ncbi:MAG: sigma 54-interacting transcriptional regulator, partial [Myxococcales bacterium]|nr:sigma 54-interacting transcriptional regulator [Myxococcales bacterium]
MRPEEIRSIRGALSRAAFARRLGVSPLTVLRWELPDGNKEARRPRAKMVDAIRKLEAEGAGTAPPVPGDDDDADADASEPAVPVSAPPEPPAPPTPPAYAADEALVHPILDRLGTESWQVAEHQLLGLLSAGSLQTNEGRLLATLGIVHGQLFARFDLRGALATLLPILAEGERGHLPRGLAARAQAVAALLFSSPDARFFDPGRVNACVARAGSLLDPDDPRSDDLRVYAATAAIQATRFLGPTVLARTYETHRAALARTSCPLAKILAESCHHLVALVRDDRAAVARHGQAYLALVERMRLPYLYVAIFVSLAHQAMHGTARPDEILSLVRDAQLRASGVASTEEILRLHACEIEAHVRAGHFDEAEAVYRTALASAHRDGIPVYPLVAAACHLFVVRNRREDIEALGGEIEADGPPRAGPNHHALYARAAALLAASEMDGAALHFERVCSAPETAAGIDDLRHYAYFGLVVARIAQGVPERTWAALRRFEALLGERPSVWHSAALRRLEGFALFQERRLAEARQKLESVLPAFRLLGDVTQQALAELHLAGVAHASGAPGGEERVAAAVRALETMGLAHTQSVRMVRAQAQARPAAWSEPTMCERLAVAVDRLSLCRVPADRLRQEIAAIVRGLFPVHAVNVAPAPSAQAATRGGIDIPDGAAGLLRVTVDGDLSAEQLAALSLLKSLCASAGAARVASEIEAVDDATLPGFVAVAPATRRLKREIAQLSRSSATILITGESGSGKEVVARGVHDLSARADRPYIAFNCASVPRDLFEAQLFGYKKGAFTGATSDNPGVIRAANAGTLFLDEIAELPLETQPKLLRVLENGEIFPVGEQRPRHVDFRIVAATHVDLGRLVRDGKFREDLYYRLNVVPLSVPPLRERVEDV